MTGSLNSQSMKKKKAFNQARDCGEREKENWLRKPVQQSK